MDLELGSLGLELSRVLVSYMMLGLRSLSQKMGWLELMKLP